MRDDQPFIIFQTQKANLWYYVNTPDAWESLQSHYHQLTGIIPFWYGVNEAGGLVDQADPKVLNFARQNKLPILAIIHNFADPAYGALIHRLLTDENLRRKLVDSIAQLMRRQSFTGVNIDFEFVPPADRPSLNAFMRQLYEALHPDGYQVTISLPAQVRENPKHPFSGAFEYSTLGRYSDEAMILAYDENFTKPGPVASRQFVETVLGYAVTKIPREKIKLGVPVYGYEWPETGGIPRTLSHAEAVALAERFGATIEYDEQVGEPHFTYTEDNVKHIVWFENARSFAVKLDLVRRYNLAGIAVWRLGQEDPGVWDLLPI